MTRIAAIVLAAGFSRRFGPTNKLLTNLGGEPALTHVLSCVAAAPVDERYIVVNSDCEEIPALCDTKHFTIVENKDASDGIGRSIAVGMKHAGSADAVLIVLGDMPLVSGETYLSLLNAFAENSEKLIAAPEYEGRRGHPVLFASPLFEELISLTGDAGAKDIIKRNEKSLLTVSVDDPGIHRDFDTPSDVERIRIAED